MHLRPVCQFRPMRRSISRAFTGTAQDECASDPKLTLNIGLRWEMVFPESTAPGNGATFNLSNGLMYVFGEGGCRITASRP